MVCGIGSKGTRVRQLPSLPCHSPYKSLCLAGLHVFQLWQPQTRELVMEWPPLPLLLGLGPLRLSMALTVPSMALSAVLWLSSCGHSSWFACYGEWLHTGVVGCSVWASPDLIHTLLSPSRLTNPHSSMLE